jgi:hypothetical protein
MGGGGRAAGEPGSASPGGGRRNRYDDFGGDLSDEMDDFIVDGEDGDRRRARRRRDARVAQAAGLSTAAVQVGEGGDAQCGALLVAWSWCRLRYVWGAWVTLLAVPMNACLAADASADI